MLVKLTADGEHEWIKVFDNGGIENVASVQVTSDGGFVIAGSTSDSESLFGNTDVWLLKTDRQGNEEWSRKFGGSKYDNGAFATQLQDGGFIVTGGTASFGGGGVDVWLIRLL